MPGLVRRRLKVWRVVACLGLFFAGMFTGSMITGPRNLVLAVLAVGIALVAAVIALD